MREPHGRGNPTPEGLGGPTLGWMVENPTRVVGLDFLDDVFFVWKKMMFGLVSEFFGLQFNDVWFSF